MNRPKLIEEQEAALKALIEKDNLPCVAATDVAALLGMDVDCLRTAAEHGTCPFAIGGRSGLHNNRFIKIPKMALWNWLHQNQG